VTVGPAMAFAVATCIRDSIHAQAWLLAFFVFGFSGLWPVAKLALMALAWGADGSHLAVEDRERLLRFLDEFGKYSLVDMFLTVLALQSYKIQWKASSEGHDIAVNVVPVPKKAFFSFVAATVLSLIVGHVTTFLHKRAAEVDEGLPGVDDSPTKKACVKPLSRFASSRRLRWQLTAGLSATGAVIFLSALTPSFFVSTSGVFSAIILDPQRETTTYSLYSLGAAITEGIDPADDLGSVMVQLVLFTFALVIPLLSIGALLLLWCMPMTLQSQSRVLDICHCLDAWASFDVFALAVWVARAQFGTMASFLVYHDNIERLCTWVREHLHSECFHIECGLTEGFVFAACAGAASYLVPKLAFSACHAAMEARACAEDGGLTECTENCNSIEEATQSASDFGDTDHEDFD